jgi:hypothetical protein
MPIKLIDEKEIPGAANYMVTRDINEFWMSDATACEVDVTRYKNTQYARASYATCVARKKLPISVIYRGERLFMLKKRNEKEGE